MVRPIAAIVLFGLSACAQQVTLGYAPVTPPARSGAGAVIGQVSTTDRRNEADPTWIGTIRGGFGNPLKVLHNSGPLAQSVTQDFRDALLARGLLATEAAGRFDLDVKIIKLQGNQVVRREAEVDLTMAVIDRSSGATVYRNQASADLVTGSFLAVDTGVLASGADLQAVIQTALGQAIDRLLDNPEFLLAIRRS
jgi:hypothetical protein